jgi:DNA-binding CsgD family transcriptional regulator
MNDGHAHLLEQIQELSRREREVLLLMLGGHGEQEMSQRLYLSKNTLHSHVKRLYKKMSVNSRSALIAKWVSPSAVESLRAMTYGELAQTGEPGSSMNEPDHGLPTAG